MSDFLLRESVKIPTEIQAELDKIFPKPVQTDLFNLLYAFKGF